jgi:hypothetical protein
MQANEDVAWESRRSVYITAFMDEAEDNSRIQGRHEVIGSDRYILQPRWIMKRSLSYMLFSFHFRRFLSVVFRMHIMSCRVRWPLQFHHRPTI